MVNGPSRFARPVMPDGKKRALSVEKTAVFGYCGMASGTASGNCGKSATDRDGKGVAIIVMGEVRPRKSGSHQTPRWRGQSTANSSRKLEVSGVSHSG